MALGWQALEAKKADTPFEQGRPLEEVAARIKRLMGLTAKVMAEAGPVVQSIHRVVAVAMHLRVAARNNS